MVESEKLFSTALGEIGLNVDLRLEAAELRSSVTYGVQRAIENDPSVRRRAVRWVVVPQGRLQAKFSGSLDWIWNGMRNLPYEDEEIAAAIGLCFALHRFDFARAEFEELQGITDVSWWPGLRLIERSGRWRCEITKVKTSTGD